MGLPLFIPNTPSNNTIMSAGIQSVISFAKETTWGTAVTPNKSLAIRSGSSIDVKENIQLIPAIKGLLAKNYNNIKGKIEYPGKLTFDTFADYLGYFILSAMGQDTATNPGGETIVYLHTFSEVAAKPSLTIETSVAENCRRFAGAICNELKFTGKTGEMVMAEASILAKTQAASTAITPAFSTIPAFNFAQVTVKIGGSTLTEVEDFDFTYKNNHEMVYALGNNEPAFNAANPSEAGGKLSMYLDSNTIGEYTNYLGNTNRSIEIICTGGSIGNSSAYTLDILIPSAVYTTAVTKITDKSNLLEIDFDSIYSVGSSKLISIALTNLIASY